MLKLNQQLQDVANNKNLNIISSSKAFVMFFSIQNIGHENGFKSIKPVQSEIAAILRYPSPTTEIELMKLIGSTNSPSEFVGKLLVNRKLLYQLLPDNVKFQQNIVSETLFLQNKISLAKNVCQLT